MQCYRPLHIQNRKLAYRDGFDKPSLFVPCNNCLACRSNLQNDWTIRAYFHWRYYQSIGGRTLFITNTYRQNLNEYGSSTVPKRCFYRVDPDTGKRKRVTFTCFSKDDIDTYINSIRKYFRRKYDIGKNSSDTSINYLVCCEYGSQNTFAPHYHILLFFPPCSASNEEIKQVCDRLWSKGFSYYSPLVKGGAFVNSVFGIKYCAKYCTKDLDFYNKDEIVEALQNKKRKASLKRNLPKHWQSNGFGVSMCLYIDSLSDPLKALTSGVRMEHDLYKYNVPLYVRNKMLFDVYYLRDDKGNILHTLRKLNDFGYSLAPRLYDWNIKHNTDNLSFDISFLGLQKYFIDNNDFFSWYQDYYQVKPPKDLNLVQFSRYLKELLGEYSVHELALYSYVWRGHVSSDLDLGCWNVDELFEMSKDVFLDRAYNDYKTVWNIPDLRNPDLHQVTRCNYLLNRFETLQDFEQILLILESIKQRFNKRRSEAKNDRFLMERKLKQKFIYSV